MLARGSSPRGACFVRAKATLAQKAKHARVGPCWSKTVRRALKLLMSLLVAAASLSLAFPISVRAQERVALVIGNNHYPNLPPDRQLTRAVNDGRAVGNALQRIGYTVIRGVGVWSTSFSPSRRKSSPATWR